MKIYKIARLSAFLFVFLVLFLGNKTTAEASYNKDVETIIGEYFSDTSDLVSMLEIARCESNLRQFTDAGNVLRGHGTVGVFQIHEVSHLNKATSLGFDLKTIKGNVAYTRYIYDKEGLFPWRFSGYCWEEPARIKKIEAKAETAALLKGSENIEDRKKPEEKSSFVALAIENTDTKQIIKLKQQINLLINLLALIQEQNKTA